MTVDGIVVEVGAVVIVMASMLGGIGLGLLVLDALQKARGAS